MMRYNIKMLDDTLQILNKGSYEVNGKRVYLKLTNETMKKVQVLLPDDIRDIENRNDIVKNHCIKRCDYNCINNDSFMVARNRIKQIDDDLNNELKPVLVLNLANPINPGGGVRRGARAQEEDLCRKSSLLLSLESEEAKKYYEYNRSLNTLMGSDAMIFTPQVEIIRDEKGDLLDDTVIVAVLTCAAPMVTYGKEGMSEDEYQAMLYKRIMGMLKCAAYFNYKNLVLGAWGCGAFSNDAHVVSDIFYKALKELEYNNLVEKDLFDSIDFAVLDRSMNKYNFNEFYRNFGDGNFYREEDQKEFDEANQRIMESEKYLDKIRGCLVAGAIGDALGYPIEFYRESEIFSIYGEKGIQAYELNNRSRKAIVSDDTQMSLFTANGMLVADTKHKMQGTSGTLRQDIRNAYRDWLLTQKVSYVENMNDEYPSSSWLLDVPELYCRRAPGITCLSALNERSLKSEEIEDYINNPLNDSKGCGGIMRVAPLALKKYDDIGTCNFEAAQIAAITHGHSLGYMSASVLVHIINRIVYPIKNQSLVEIIIEARDHISKLFAYDKHLKELINIIDKAIALAKNDKSDLDNIHELGEGWVAEETLAIALYCSLRYQHNFSAAIIAAVNHNGDSDSTGAVTGNILGAIHGYDAIEDKWKKDLELLDVILEMADDLCHGCQMQKNSSYYALDWDRKYMKMKWKDDDID